MLAYVWTALAIVWIGNTVLLLYRRQTAGELLLDLGPVPKRYLMWACATTLFGVAVMLLLRPTREGVSQQLSYLVWGIYMTIAGLGRLQLRDKGVSTGYDVVPWHRVRSFDKDGLRFQRMLGDGTLPVTLEPNQAEQVRAILDARKPAEK